MKLIRNLVPFVIICKIFATSNLPITSYTTETVIKNLASSPIVKNTRKIDEKRYLKPKKSQQKKMISESYLREQPTSLVSKTFDFQYIGTLIGALYALKEYDPRLDVLSPLGKKQNIQVNLDLAHIGIQDVIDVLNQQANGGAKIVFDPLKNNIRAYFDTHTDFGIDAVTESKKWQEGGNIRPVLTKDGVVLFPYGEQQMQVVCETLQLCDITFEPGEYMTSTPVIGDSLRWKINDAISQENSLIVQHLIVTPQSSGLNTSLLVPTNKRTYMIKLRSSSQGYVARVGFYYPKEFNIHPHLSQSPAKSEISSGVTEVQQAHLAPEDWDFNYELSGDTPKWKPVRVFSDGHLTYIQLPSGVNATNLPTFTVLGSDGTSQQAVNFSIKNNFYIVEKIFEKAELILGNDGNQEHVLITHTIPKKGFWSKLFS